MLNLVCVCSEPAKVRLEPHLGLEAMTASFSRRTRLLQYLPPAISHFTSVESHREQPCNTSLLRRQTRPQTAHLCDFRNGDGAS